MFERLDFLALFVESTTASGCEYTKQESSTVSKGEVIKDKVGDSYPEETEQGSVSHDALWPVLQVQ